MSASDLLNSNFMRKDFVTEDGITHQNVLSPMANDLTGEKYDLSYLKNKTLSKNLMNYSVGMGVYTNP
jgi:hypothetical protein